MCDITDQLRALMTAGFRFVHPRDAGGHVVAVTGIRSVDSVVDVFTLYGEQDATAARMPADEPDVLSPRTVLWRTSGPASSVIDELLRLPEPATTSHDRDRRGCWVPTRPGRATWLPATA